MDPAEKTLWLAPGNPCSTPFERLDLGDALAKPPLVGRAA